MNGNSMTDILKQTQEARNFLRSKGFTTTGSTFIFVKEEELHLLNEEDVLHILMIGSNPVIISDTHSSTYFKKHYKDIVEKYRLVLE
jgi:hypothetical protein